VVEVKDGSQERSANTINLCFLLITCCRAEQLIIQQAAHSPQWWQPFLLNIRDSSLFTAELA
jgi:hypothetical protein